jgi:hypothetical protein
VPLYIAYFALGVYAYRHAWFVEGGWDPPLVESAIWAAFSGGLYLSLRLSYGPWVQSTPLLHTANAVFFNLFCFTSLVAGVALFRRPVVLSSAAWDSLAANSYGMYYVHPMVVYPLSYVLLSLPLPVILKAFLLIAVSIPLSWAVSEWVLRRAPLLRRMFSGSD